MEGVDINVMPISSFSKLRVPMRTTRGGLVTANGGREAFLGVTELSIDVGGICVNQIVYIIEHANYEFLAGHPWKSAVRHKEETDNSGRTYHWIYSQDGEMSAKFTSEGFKSSSACSQTLFCYRVEVLPLVTETVKDLFQVETKYKRVGEKVKPVLIDLQDGTIPFDWTKSNQESNDSLEEIQEKMNQIKIGEGDFLTLEETGVFEEIVLKNIKAFAFKASEIGRISESVVKPYTIRTVPHEPWVMRPLPMQEKIRVKGMQMIKEKLEGGFIEPCHGLYSNRYWLVPKKSGATLYPRPSTVK
jgi:hypothetical protein